MLISPAFDPLAVHVVQPYVVGDTLYASSTSAISKLPIGTTNQILKTVAGLPSWGTIDLAASPASVTGILPVANGGTGATALTLGSVVFAGTAGVYTQDNDKFFWDNTNKRLGLGTNAPTNPLHVYYASGVTGTNYVVCNMAYQSSNGGGSGIFRIFSQGTNAGIDFEANSYGSGPFRFGTYGDFNFVNNGQDLTGVFGGINFVTTKNILGMKIGGGTNAGNINMYYKLDVTGLTTATGSIALGNATTADIKTDTTSPTDMTLTTGAAKTLKLNTSVWKDVFFPMGTPKAVGLGNPSLLNWIGNLSNYTFSVNDVHNFDPQEFPHDGKQGATTCSIHVHWISRTNVAATRGVKWEVEYSQSNIAAVFPATTTISAEETVAANTTAFTHYLTTIGTFTAGNIGGLMCLRLKRITAAGTAPADDPIVLAVHYHYEVDTIGSRQITTK